MKGRGEDQGSGPNGPESTAVVAETAAAAADVNRANVAEKPREIRALSAVVIYIHTTVLLCRYCERLLTRREGNEGKKIR